MYKVAIIGPESTGKTSLARFLAARYSGCYIPEYAREYVEALAPTYAYTMQDVIHIAQYQIDQLASMDCPLTFFDTDLIITKVWLQHKYGQCPDFINEALQRYPMDAYLLCYPDIPWEPDPVRENPDIREYLFDCYEREIQSLNIPYYIIRHD